MTERTECIPSLATPKPLPRPEPFRKAGYNLDLTPEKKSRNVRADNQLSAPTLNSTAKIQFQIEKLKRKKKITASTMAPYCTDPALTRWVKSDALKAVNIPFNTRLYSDLVSVEVPSGITDTLTAQPAHSYKSTKATEAPDISDFSDHCIISETASWSNDWAPHEPQLLLPPVDSVYILYRHMHSVQ